MSEKTNAPKKPVEAAPAPGGRRRGPASMSQVVGSMDNLKRAMKYYIKCSPVLFGVIVFCALFGAVTAAAPGIFLQKVTEIIQDTFQSGDWIAARPRILALVIPLVCIYIVAVSLSVLQSQLQAHLTQNFMHRLRTDLFNKMQSLPLRYFDTHKHGDIMSHYTNDIDTLRQMVSMALPTIIRAGVVVIAVFLIMISYSIWMTLIVIVGIIAMMVITGKVGAGSAKYFIRQQKAIAATEGFVQEIMNGQKVVKVFNHESHLNSTRSTTALSKTVRKQIPMRTFWLLSSTISATSFTFFSQ